VLRINLQKQHLIMNQPKHNLFSWESKYWWSFYASSKEALDVWKWYQDRLEKNMELIEKAWTWFHSFQISWKLQIDTVYKKSWENPIIKEMMIFSDGLNIPWVNDKKVQQMLVTLECEPKDIPELAYLLKEQLL